MSKGKIIRERYETTARGYDELYRAEQFEKYFVTIKRIPPRGIVLDAGCGTGLLIEFLALNKLLGEVNSYVCLDYSREMLKVAMGRAKVFCPNKCFIVEGNVEELPFENGSFDIVYSFTVLDLVDNLKKSLGELERVSKRLIVFSMLKTLPYKDYVIKSGYKLVGTTQKDAIFYIELS